MIGLLTYNSECIQQWSYGFSVCSQEWLPAMNLSQLSLSLTDCVSFYTQLLIFSLMRNVLHTVCIFTHICTCFAHDDVQVPVNIHFTRSTEHSLDGKRNGIYLCTVTHHVVPSNDSLAACELVQKTNKESTPHDEPIGVNSVSKAGRKVSNQAARWTTILQIKYTHTPDVNLLVLLRNVKRCQLVTFQIKFFL